MDKSNYTLEQIDDYIMGLMSEEDRVLFEKDLLTNQELAMQLKKQQDLVLGVEEYHRGILKDKLGDIHKRHFSDQAENKPLVRSMRPWLAIAATISLLLIGYIWMNSSGANSSDQLYAKYFEPYDVSIAQRDNTDQQLLQLDQLYKDQDYKEALAIINNLNAENKKDIQIQLAAGISKLELNQATEAIPHFEFILASNDLLFKDHANWYLALSHLKLGDKTKAKLHLMEIIKDENADHFKDAKQLLDEIN